jgi:hypothetical protein
MKTQNEDVSPLEAARTKAAEAKREHASAREALAIAKNEAASLKPEDFETPGAFTKKREAARAKEASASDAEAFWAARVRSAEAALAPLEVEELHREIDGGLVGRAAALAALRLACEGLAPQLERVREAVVVIRENHAGIEKARADLVAKGEKPRKSIDADDVALLVVHQVDSKLATPVSLLEACVALEKLEAERPGREAQAAEGQRRIDAQNALERRRTALRGDLGEDERKKAEKEQKENDFWRRSNGRSAIYEAAKGTSAHAELEIARQNLGLK